MQIDWLLLMPAPLLGQLPAPPGSSAAPTETAAGAAGTGAAAPTGGAPGGNSLLYLIGLMLVAMIVFSLMGQRRDRKRRQALLASIKKHDRVQTVGGVIGSVVELKPDTVVLKVDESSNTRITFARSAIQQVLTSSPEGAAPPGKVE